MSHVTAGQGIERVGGPASTDGDRVKIRALAEQFESMLLAQMLEDMKRAMTPDAETQGLGGQIMGDAMTSELALSLGRSGGLGLSELLATALARIGSTPDAEPSSPGAVAWPTGVAGRAAPGPATTVPGPTPPTAEVTSEFGWRVDPLNGQPRFHAGLDLRAAYGQEVRSATGGTVTFAGEKPGYGTVVVVSHGSGLETRYAHLSSLEVTEGSQVRAGEVLARSGASGRATGPHLHFEVRRHGHPVDPALVASLMPAVGPQTGEADQ
ncbi:MAG: peptidoglycan DD-metalloendopeptidase family protein [Acidobacteria bacterium]|nr:peptidoglycan DD-metalloendopeptidase family protein [Acidobacteriota bacterium]